MRDGVDPDCVDALPTVYAEGGPSGKVERPRACDSLSRDASSPVLS